MTCLLIDTLVSILSTMGLGWGAGLLRRFDGTQIAQLNVLVMENGLPAFLIIIASAGASHVLTRLRTA
ncbi:MAG TPA: hypothetical protein VHY79_08095 [Rhizomicrobium sp.]|jgi:hypothetical protein|nr:hypothetical protein [Rhizomicrobium sp.]